MYNYRLMNAGVINSCIGNIGVRWLGLEAAPRRIPEPRRYHSTTAVLK